MEEVSVTNTDNLSPTTIFQNNEKKYEKKIREIFLLRKSLIKSSNWEIIQNNLKGVNISKNSLFFKNSNFPILKGTIQIKTHESPQNFINFVDQLSILPDSPMKKKIRFRCDPMNVYTKHKYTFLKKFHLFHLRFHVPRVKVNLKVLSPNSKKNKKKKGRDMEYIIVRTKKHVKTYLSILWGGSVKHRSKRGGFAKDKECDRGEITILTWKAKRIKKNVVEVEYMIHLKDKNNKVTEDWMKNYIVFVIRNYVKLFLEVMRERKKMLKGKKKKRRSMGNLSKLDKKKEERSSSGTIVKSNSFMFPFKQRRGLFKDSRRKSRSKKEELEEKRYDCLENNRSIFDKSSKDNENINLVSGDSSGNLQFWNLKSGRRKLNLYQAHKKKAIAQNKIGVPINSIIALPNRRIASASQNGLINIYNWPKLKPNMIDDALHFSITQMISFRNRIFAGSTDGTIRMYKKNLKGYNNCTNRFINSDREWVTSVDILSYKLLVSASKLFLKVWDIDKIVLKKTVKTPHFVTKIKKMDTPIFVGIGGDKLSFFNLSRGKCVKTMNISDSDKNLCPMEGCDSVVTTLTENGNIYSWDMIKNMNDLISVATSKGILLVDTRNYAIVHCLTPKSNQGIMCTSLARISNDYFAGGYSNNTIKIWDIRKMKPYKSLDEGKAGRSIIRSLTYLKKDENLEPY